MNPSLSRFIELSQLSLRTVRCVFLAIPLAGCPSDTIPRRSIVADPESYHQSVADAFAGLVEHTTEKLWYDTPSRLCVSLNDEDPNASLMRALAETTPIELIPASQCGEFNKHWFHLVEASAQNTLIDSINVEAIWGYPRSGDYKIVTGTVVYTLRLESGSWSVWRQYGNSPFR